MFRLLAIFLALLIIQPASAQRPRQNAIQPELIAEGPAVPGGEVELAILMHTQPGWHGYWLNPGDAGLPMTIEWQLPDGASVAPLRYPVPDRLLVAGIVNYVYEKDYAILTRLRVPQGIAGPLLIRAKANWLACTDKVCVPERGEFSLQVPVGETSAKDGRFDDWRRALPRPLAASAHFKVASDRLEIAVPLPASVEIGQPYFFPADDGPIDYAAPQSFRRKGDTLIAELKRRRGEPQSLSGVLAFGDGRGLDIKAVPGPGRARRATADPDARDAQRPRSPPPPLAGRAHTFLPATQVSRTCVRASACASTLLTSRSTRMKSAHLPGSRLPSCISAKLA